MSAPASAWLTAVRASSSRVGSFSTSPLCRQHAAVAVVGVFTEADIADHAERQVGGLKRPHRLLHDAVAGICAAAECCLCSGGRRTATRNRCQARAVPSPHPQACRPDIWYYTGIDVISSLTSRPCVTKSG